MICAVEYQKLYVSERFVHCADDHYLIVLNKNPCLYSFEGKSYCADAEHIVCCRPGEEITVEATEEYLLLSYLLFSPPTSVPIDNLPLPGRIPFHPPNFYELSDFLRRLYNLYHSADKYREQKMEGHLHVLLYCASSGDEEVPKSGHIAALQHQLRLLRRRISDDPTAFPTVEEAAAFVGISASHFQHLYRQYFHTSYIHDRVRAKIARARSLLKNTDLPISAIARELGYESETFFSRQFRQQMGITPTTYRKMNI